jgi:Holliday junction resolvase RusA-like endonuclease
VTRRLTFVIPAVPPSLNRLLRNRRLRSSEPSKWKLLVRVHRPRTVPLWPGRVVVWLTFFGVKGDADNYGKLVLDGLVYAGVIPDDGPKHVAAVITRGSHGFPGSTLRHRSTFVTIETEGDFLARNP